MSLLEKLEGSNYNPYQSPAYDNSEPLQALTRIIGQGIKHARLWKSQAMGDPTFDPPMPDATIPTDLQSYPNKNVGWVHTYLVTTDPGREPVISFPNAPSHLILDSEVKEISAQNYRVDVVVGTKEMPASGTLEIQLDDRPVGVHDENPNMPREYKLINFPNPFNSQTTIEYSLPESSDIELNVYDIKGELVQRIFKGNQPTGQYRVNWDGKGLDGNTVNSGVYLLQLKTPDQQKTFKMMMLK
jgi:hypothetical protein